MTKKDFKVYAVRIEFQVTAENKSSAVEYLLASLADNLDKNTNYQVIDAQEADIDEDIGEEL